MKGPKVWMTDGSGKCCENCRRGEVASIDMVYCNVLNSYMAMWTVCTAYKEAKEESDGGKV